jgi:predicted molibdopterin-dependent oxidoreductase YjgC
MVSRPDSEILSLLAKELKAPALDASTPAEIMDEIARTVPFFTGVSYPALETNRALFGKGNQGETGTAGSAPKSSVRALSSERPDKDYPFRLLAVFDEFVFRSAPIASRVVGLRGIERAGKAVINVKDAEAMGIDTNMPVKLISRRGSATANAVVSEDVLPGVIEIVDRGPGPYSVLMQPSLIDAEGKIAEELCAVRIEKL